MKPVPVDVVTGFLGAGKTTLLAHVLRNGLDGQRIAVVMNELGDASIDGRVIEGLEHVERMIELPGGCVCCAIDDVRFELAVQELVERADPTLIVLETTGAADPGPLALRLARAGLPLDAVITVVDAASIERALAQTSVAAAQLEAADFILVNKIDLVDGRERARLRRRIRRRNGRALVEECERGAASVDLLFATGGRRYRDAAGAPAAGDPRHLHGDGISAFSWRGPRELDRGRFERFLRRLAPEIYRAKGIVRFSQASWHCLFNYTCGRYELNWIQLVRAGAGSEAVFIGRDAVRMRQHIVQALEACEAR
jgi:G3E family GTPase